jgi:hypothetical protein
MLAVLRGAAAFLVPLVPFLAADFFAAGFLTAFLAVFLRAAVERFFLAGIRDLLKVSVYSTNIAQSCQRATWRYPS